MGVGGKGVNRHHASHTTAYNLPSPQAIGVLVKESEEECQIIWLHGTVEPLRQFMYWLRQSVYSALLWALQVSAMAY
jgi:hypothetical protein